MLIDIDIKIADNEGKLIRHFSKRFDEQLNIPDKIGKGNGVKKEFEEFLAEYLTPSGRFVREKLICEPYMPDIYHYNSVIPTDKNLFTEEDLKGTLAFSGLEYKIRFPDQKEITGEIPFYKLKRLHKLTNALDAAENDKSEVPDGKLFSNPSDYPGLYKKSNYEINKKEVAEMLEKDLKNLMLRAVERYELNFYHISEENENI